MSQASDHVNDGRRCAHLRSVATPVNKCVVVWYRRLCDTVGNHICRGIWRFGSKNSNVLSTITTSDANLSQWLKTTCNHFSAKYGTAHFFTHCKLQPFKLELRMVDLLRCQSGKGLRVDFHPESSRFLCSLLLKIDNRVYRAQYTLVGLKLCVQSGVYWALIRSAASVSEVTPYGAVEIRLFLTPSSCVFLAVS